VPRYSQDIEEDDEVMVEQSDAEPDSPIVKNKQNGGVQSKSKGLQHEGGEVDSRTVRSNMTSKRRTNMRYSNADVDDDQVREAAEDDDLGDSVRSLANAVTSAQQQAALASRAGGTGLSGFNQQYGRYRSHAGADRTRPEGPNTDNNRQQAAYNSPSTTTAQYGTSGKGPGPVSVNLQNNQAANVAALNVQKRRTDDDDDVP